MLASTFGSITPLTLPPPVIRQPSSIVRGVSTAVTPGKSRVNLEGAVWVRSSPSVVAVSGKRGTSWAWTSSVWPAITNDGLWPPVGKTTEHLPLPGRLGGGGLHESFKRVQPFVAGFGG